MTAYWIASANLRDFDGLQRYADILSTVEGRYPFKTLARSTRFMQLEGESRFEQHYLHSFPSMEAALALYNSPEYQEAAAIRRAACDGCELLLLDGGDGLTAKD